MEIDPTQRPEQTPDGSSVNYQELFDEAQQEAKAEQAAGDDEAAPESPAESQSPAKTTAEQLDTELAALQAEDEGTVDSARPIRALRESTHTSGVVQEMFVDPTQHKNSSIQQFARESLAQQQELDRRRHRRENGS